MFSARVVSAKRIWQKRSSGRLRRRVFMANAGDVTWFLSLSSGILMPLMNKSCACAERVPCVESRSKPSLSSQVTVV